MPNSAVVLPTAWDFAPSAQNPDTSLTLDAAILAYSPWAYWKLNETSGAPQDSSGNNRHGHVSSGTSMTYNGSPITSRSGPSITLENARLGFPQPIAHPSQGGKMSIGGLFYFENEIGIGSPAQVTNGSPFIHQSAANYLNTSDFILSYARMYTETFIVRSVGQIAGMQGGPKLNTPMFIFLQSIDIPWVIWSWEVWINGVLMFTGPSSGSATAPTASFFHVGRNVDSAAPFAKFRVSNLACWNGALTPRQIIDITEFGMDTAAYALAHKP